MMTPVCQRWVVGQFEFAAAAARFFEPHAARGLAGMSATRSATLHTRTLRAAALAMKIPLWEVVLTDVGNARIALVKELREVNGASHTHRC